MTKPPPDGHREAADLLNSNTAPALSSIELYSPSTFARLDDLTRAELRSLWWRQNRLGNRLPAEPGLIVLDGGADDPTWPRTGAPQAEASPRRGGRR